MRVSESNLKWMPYSGHDGCVRTFEYKEVSALGVDYLVIEGRKHSSKDFKAKQHLMADTSTIHWSSHCASAELLRS